MKAPETYRIFIPSTRKTVDFGGAGSAAMNAFMAMRKNGLQPELAEPGTELKVSCLLTGRQGECDCDSRKTER